MSTPLEDKDALSEDINSFRPFLDAITSITTSSSRHVLRRCEVSSSNKWWMEEGFGEDCSFANTTAAVLTPPLSRVK